MNSDVVCLSRKYSCISGSPTIDRVSLDIFNNKYFSSCMDCGYCNDICCSFGVDVDILNVERINHYADMLKNYVPIPREDWFEKDFREDSEFPGGLYTRTRVHDGRCVFLNRSERGCILHTFCLAEGIDYHVIKPMVSSLFPVTFDSGLLHASDEVYDASLICLGDGVPLYQSVRQDLMHYFGDGLTSELDVIYSRSSDSLLGVKNGTDNR